MKRPKLSASGQQEGPMPRSASRIAAVQALYQMDMAATDIADVIDEFTSYRLEDAGNEDDSDKILAGADPTFFAEIVRGVVRLQRDIDPLVDKTLATGWRLVRVDSILRAILRAAVFELMDRQDVPVRVVINEYINVAHAFFSDDEPRVVNGVLDRIARQIRSGEFADKGPETADG